MIIMSIDKIIDNNYYMIIGIYVDEGNNKGTKMIRTFHFERKEDASGVSGCGMVAEGVVFSNGHVALTWLSKHPSVNIYDSIEDVELIHGHEGKTRIVFDDDQK